MQLLRSFALFTHLCGMLLLFGGLAVEFATTKSRSRVYAGAFALILLSGVWLAAREGLLALAWVRVSFIAMLVMAAAGAPRFRAFTLRPRMAVGLAIVYLMISKLGAAGSLLVIGVALLGGVIASVLRPRAAVATTQPSSSGAPVW